MKKVRFESPTTVVMGTMRDYECHSPRPFIERQILNIGAEVNQSRQVIFTKDPVQRYENDNSSPHPIENKTYLNSCRKLENRNIPSSDLDLSMLDSSQKENRGLSSKINILLETLPNRNKPISVLQRDTQPLPSHKILTSIENKTTEMHPPNILNRDNNFFLRRENLGKLSFDTVHQQLDHTSTTVTDNPLRKKSEIIRIGTSNTLTEKENLAPRRTEFNMDCKCHHCIKIVNQTPCNFIQNNSRNVEHLCRMNYNTQNCSPTYSNCSCNCNIRTVEPICHCNQSQQPLSPVNSIDKKTWAIEKYEKSRVPESSDVDKCNKLSKDKREPTVSDLFKIIKLQNEQLQMLQEKVDKFISTHNCEVQEKQTIPIQNYVTEQLAVQTVNSEQHKISIGVMTSFEMVRTSTVINKEIVKQCEAQIQCNRSQISIKEVVSKKQAGNLNFLDGITPVSKRVDQMKGGIAQTCSNVDNIGGCQTDNVNEDKTFNEMSLYNLQMDNATTPLMSPEQSLYLDIRDYSESDSGSDDQSNVGWTYYNKVMSHVNGLLHDSDMPSSASALYRQTKQKCMQMQIDKSNVSVGKRVTFGDDPLGVQQQQQQQQHVVASTDTSLKMNKLAAKYLKHTPTSHVQSPRANDQMSFATRNYMERHKLLQGQQTSVQNDIPRFLDITALKQQPKFI